jgi:uncharacterized membrane protein YfcA
MAEFTLSQWLLMVFGAALIGLSKSGLPGLGILAVPLFASVIPAKDSTGFILPMLVAGDLIGVALFGRHAEWKYLWKLFPLALVGVLIGWQALGWLNNAQIRPLIGIIVLVMLTLNFWRQRHPDLKNIIPTGWWFAAVTGLTAGFTTMVANAAGPIMIIYLLAMRLPPAAFIGTSAWYFLLVNTFKIPFSAQLGLITPVSLKVNLLLLPGIAVGALAGILFARRVPRHVFDWLVQGLAAAGALKLLF